MNGAAAPSTGLATTDRAPRAKQKQRLRRLLAIVRALASENAELIQELRRARERILSASDRERRRIERDLHDGAQQSLVAVHFKLVALANQRVDDEKLAAKLDEIAADAKAALGELRALVHGIYPAVLVDRGVPDALRSFAATAPISVRVGATNVRRLSAPIEAALYFCAVEAIHNAAKHAGPSTNVEVSLTERPDTVEFQIDDDGPGFDTTAATDGNGLVNMIDRIGALGGTLEVASTPGQGTTIMASVPVSPPTVVSIGKARNSFAQRSTCV
jgi:signal transduction histidine kinase